MKYLEVDEIEVVCNIKLNMKSLEEFDRILLKNIEKVFYEINVLEFEKELIISNNICILTVCLLTVFKS